MRKLIIALILILACAIFVTGCNTDGESASSDSSSDTVAETEKNETATNNGETNQVTDSEGATENGTAADVESETKKGITASCIVKKGNRYVIVLPISGETIPVGSSYTKYLPNVTDESVRAAEAKITEQVTALGETPEWSIGKNEADELCLMVEVIQMIEGADENGEGGCGIDHEHLFFEEPIIGE